MSDAFDSAKADFSGMAKPSKEGRLWLSKVFHSAAIEIDELGIKAAAATAVVTQSWGAAMPNEPRELAVDRPFLFFVTDGEFVLFMGRVVAPTPA